KKEIIAHVVNMLLMLEIVLWINTERQLILILNGYILMALIAIVIGYYGFFFEQIPFEHILRTLGPDAAVNALYIIQDGDFFRFSGPFMDPNFFGIYLLSILIFAIWLYIFRGRNKLHLIFAFLALVTLPLTLSRTSMIGFVCFFGVFIYWLRIRLRTLVLMASLLLCVLGFIAILISYPNLFDRLLDTESAFDRMHFISKGFEAFVAHPLLGSGPAGIIDADTGIATAHLMYLSILAKFGLVGAAAYFTFIFYPLIFVIFRKRRFLKEYRLLIIGLYVPLFFMYFMYDFMSFLEFQYLIFAVGYSVVFSPYAKKSICEERSLNSALPLIHDVGRIASAGME
ncbi:MAG: O-antigen ligase family protein, partial [Candidatus Magasanikbacteria bacterium]|nr:O-antigen ligase family protein [Candidatus Magasanikbacteria bacterium]